VANFAPKAEAGKAKGSLAKDNMSEHQEPPRIYLEHHHLEKLLPKGAKMPPVGSKIKISGLAHVGSTSENDASPPSGGKAQKGGEGNTKRTMTLHLHKMDMGTGTQPGVSDVDQDAEKAKGAKSAMDKALKRGAGGDGEDSEGEEDMNARTPRGGQD
jgi:hypothetical protein